MITIFTGLPVTPATAAKYPWLEPLARAYELVDNAIRMDLAARTRAGQPQPACRAGCHACCLAPVLDVSQVEMQGLSWYVSEILAGPRRSIVNGQLRHHHDSTACPFLVDGECAAYPARPLTCRHFHVVRKACTPNEHVVKSRPEDALSLGGSAAEDAATILLQVMSGKPESLCRDAVRRGAFAASSIQMHTIVLEKFADLMDQFER